MKIDVCSLTQNGKQSLSYMSQAVGLFADLDLGTEHLRWMGDARFVFGFIRGGMNSSLCILVSGFTGSQVLQMRQCPVELSYKAAELDKNKMVEAMMRDGDPDKTTFTPGDESTPGIRLPGLKYSKEDDDGWTVFDKPIFTVFAGKVPYVSRYVHSLSSPCFLSDS
jgi:sphingosine kinase